jgi:hypothetical protein
MKWLAVTIALLALSAGLVSWIYLRDRDTSGWRTVERAQTRPEAGAVRDVLQLACQQRCELGAPGSR